MVLAGYIVILFGTDSTHLGHGYDLEVRSCIEITLI